MLIFHPERTKCQGENTPGSLTLTEVRRDQQTMTRLPKSQLLIPWHLRLGAWVLLDVLCVLRARPVWQHTEGELPCSSCRSKVCCSSIGYALPRNDWV